ncbi:MAG: DUF2130 domain-containing protein [bacterium]|nr:DUF2130 domain-containing protein [bacterium]
MNETMITCPKCGNTFNLESTVKSEIEMKFKTEYENKMRKEKEKLDEERKEIEEIKKNEKEKIENAVKEQLKEKELELRNKVRAEIQNESKEEVDIIKKQLADAKKQVGELKKKELEIEELKEQNQKMKVEVETAVKKEYNKKISEMDEKLKEKYETENKTSEMAFKQQIESMKQTIETLKKKAEQGSSKIQGEVQELMIEEELKALFPEDEIEAIKSGKKGADIIQTIKEHGKVFGRIIWESKNTANFSNDWIEKIKEDGQTEKSDLNIIITSVMPKKSNESVIQVEGVWIVNIDTYKTLAFILRDQVIKLKSMKNSFKSQDENLQVIYQYLTSSEFSGRINAIVGTFRDMKTELDDERNKMEALWAKREKQLQKVIKNYSGMYGDLKGLLGKQMPEVKLLEME